MRLHCYRFAIAKVSHLLEIYLFLFFYKTNFFNIFLKIFLTKTALIIHSNKTE
jgi:hypothetical protein